MKKINITRLLDLLPGLFVWGVIIGVFVGSYFLPVWVAYFVVLFNVYWVLKTIKMNYFYIRSFVMLRAWALFDWNGRTEALTSRSDISNFLLTEYHLISTMSLRMLYERTHKALKRERNRFITFPYFVEIPILWIQKKVAIWLIQSETNHCNRMNDSDILWNTKNIKHFIIIPFTNEPYELLTGTLDRLVNQTHDCKSFNIVLATEQVTPAGQGVAKRLVLEYAEKFDDIFMTVHPLLPGEVRGKSSNMWYAATIAQKRINERKLDENLITFTSCDSDSQFPLNYFSCLTYEFCKNPLRYKKYWCGTMSYYDNIWDVPFYVRVANTLFSANELANRSSRKLIQVSTYSGSYRLIRDIGFWSKDRVPEDWNMYFKAVFKYGKDVSTIPLFIQIFADAAGSTTYWRSFVTQYKQVKRWSWGVSDDSWIIQNMFAGGKRRLRDRISIFFKGLNATVDHFLWPLYGFVLAFGANIPPLVSKPFSNTVLGNNLSPVISFILTLSTIQFFGVILFDMELKPSRSKKNNFFNILVYLFEFLCMPITGIVFGSLPALEAHTRLLIGKRMEHISTAIVATNPNEGA